MLQELLQPLVQVRAILRIPLRAAAMGPASAFLTVTVMAVPFHWLGYRYEPLVPYSHGDLYRQQCSIKRRIGSVEQQQCGSSHCEPGYGLSYGSRSRYE